MTWPHDYKSFFMLNSTEHEISMLDKSHLVNLLEALLIYRKFHRFCLSNQTFKFDFSYNLKHQWDFKVWAQTQSSTYLSFISTGPRVFEFHPRLRRLFFQACFHLSPLQKHVRKVVGGLGKKSCVDTGVRKPGNTCASPTAMIWP